MMIRLEDGSYVNSDAVLLMETGGKNEYGCRLTRVSLRAGNFSDCNMAVGDVEDIAAAINAAHGVRAGPGYELILAPDPSDDDFYFSRSAIIAWRIDRKYGCPSPITVGGHESR